MSDSGSGVSGSVWRSPDRRFRPEGVARPTAKRLFSMTLVVGAAALSPAMFFPVPQHPSVAAVTSYLLVASGLLSVAAGGLGLMSWRTTAHALYRWLGSAFVVLGVLILVDAGLSGFRAGSIASIVPADALLTSLVAALLVWRGITDEAVGAGISPLVALGRGVGVALAVAALCIGLQAGGVIPAWASTRPVRSLLCCLSGVVWVSLTLAARRLRPCLGCTALATCLLGVGLLIRSGASTHLDAVLHSGNQLYRRLQDELDTSLRKSESDGKALTDLDIDIDIDIDLDLDLEDTLAPVIVAEQLLDARIHLDVARTNVFADRVALGRVVQNVLTNARRCAPQSPVEIEATLHKYCVKVTICDHGPGIPPAQRAAVLERWARGSSSAGKRGSGLGLYVAQSLLESTGGAIHLYDASPGCRFATTLQRGSDGTCALDGTRAPRDAGRSLGQADHLAPAV